MKATFFKLLPFILGGAIGWLLFNPPSWLHGNPTVRWSLTAVVCFLLLLLSITLMAGASLPKDLRLREATEDEVAKLSKLEPHIRRYREIGFEPISAPLCIEMQPPAFLVPMIDDSRRVYGSIFQTGNIPAKVGFDLVSRLQPPGRTLTSTQQAESAALPAGPGEFRQILGEKGDLAEMLKGHWEGLAFLESRGYPPLPLDPAKYREEFREAAAEKRRVFFASPMRNALVTLVRAATRQPPALGTLGRQAEAPKLLAQLEKQRG